MARMRFLHVIQRYYPYVGGSELYFQELGERLVAAGHHVTVLTTDAWDLDHFWAPGRRRVEEPFAVHNGVRIMRYPVQRVPGPPIVYPVLRRLLVELGKVPGTVPVVRRLSQLTPRVPELRRYLATTSDHYDLVNTTNITLDFTIVPSLAFAQRRCIPHVCTPFIHLGEPGNRYILRYYSQPHQIDLLRKSAAVLTQTSRETAFLQQQRIPADRLHEIGGWIRPEALEGGDGARFRARHNISAPIVLSIGATAYDKGTMHVVEAVQRLWRQGLDVRLVLIASNVLAQFERYWEELEPSTRERITLIKAAPHSEKLDALAAANVFALPSRTDSFGIVFLEAWYYGLPTIGANAGGIPDVIKHGRDGYLVRFGDTQQLAVYIEQLLHDPAHARAMGKRGRAKVMAEMTFEKKFQRLLGVYQAVTATSGRSPAGRDARRPHP